LESILEAQANKARLFRKLHEAKEPLVLFNAWDVESARIVESLGFGAVATSSAGIASSFGFSDGEQIGRELMLQSVSRIACAVEVPVTADLEGGYGQSAEAVSDTAEGAISAGTVGMNIEDGVRDGASLRPIEEQCLRIAAVRKTAQTRGLDFVINARIDTYLHGGRSADQLEKETLDRARAYLAAGADCIYPITLRDLDCIARLVRAIDAPLNVLVSPDGPPLDRFTNAGVKRVSFGAWTRRHTMAAFRAAAEDFTPRRRNSPVAPSE